jgi:anaerobic selenocysteine-containing dehydrogenase
MSPRARIAAGDLVSVFNERSAFEAEIDVSADTMASVVVAPMGYWPGTSRGGRNVDAIGPPVIADCSHAPP